jgi:pimeloyl-ACP methyl ester carboxylesterase
VISASQSVPVFKERPEPTVNTPPPVLWFFLELRVFFELIQVWFIAFLKLPKGDGRSVIVYPGLIARDWMTWPLRYALRRAGYDAHGWGLGMNCGPREGVLEACEAKIAQLAQSSGRPVTLIGWSLGGLMARELAKRNPLTVRDVITMGSPFSGSPRANYAWGIYQRASGETIATAYARFDLYTPPDCPVFSIYTESDGIVHWRGCTQPSPTHVGHYRVYGSHLGLPASFNVIRAVGMRMAQPFDSLARA